MFIKNRWYVFGWCSEVAGKPLGRVILGEPVVAYRTPAGTLALLEDRCCHRALPLHMGDVVGDNLRCVYHGLEYDCAGTCVKVPGQKEVPNGFRVRKYAHAERDGMIWIWPGDPALADPATIVPYPYHGDSGQWGTGYGYIRVACNYELIHDNLLDLTHLAFVHPNTIGGNPDIHFGAEMDVKLAEDTVFVQRWMRGSVPPPTYRRSVELAETVDRWQEILFRPGLVLNYSGAIDAGKGALEGARIGGYQARNLNALTPETESTTHYFYSASHHHKADDPAWTQKHFEQIQITFHEDIDILERQEKAFATDPAWKMKSVFADRAGLQARRIVARMLAAEAPQPVPAE